MVLAEKAWVSIVREVSVARKSEGEADSTCKKLSGSDWRSKKCGEGEEEISFTDISDREGNEGKHCCKKVEDGEPDPEPDPEPEPEPEPVDRELTVNEKIKLACDYFVSENYEEVHIAGIIGNLRQESSTLNPGELGDGGDSLGIAQWQGSRRDNLEEFAESKGKLVDDFETQLEFIDYELETTHSSSYRVLVSKNTIEDATEAFMKSYERPKAESAHLDKRTDYAKEVNSFCFT
tara:strand:- start:320 stop:1024 length:705 start_codon:yes stop_codon:yes gene_type:complete